MRDENLAVEARCEYREWRRGKQLGPSVQPAARYTPRQASAAFKSAAGLMNIASTLVQVESALVYAAINIILLDQIPALHNSLH